MDTRPRSPGARIRDAGPDDAAAIAPLLGELGYPAEEPQATVLLARFTGTPGSRVQLAERDGQVVGFVATHLVPRMDTDELSCRITDLVVAAEHRRSGIGSALLDAAEADAREHGAKRLDLSSGDWRGAAHAFYSARGFVSRARTYTKRPDGPRA